MGGTTSRNRRRFPAWLALLGLLLSAGAVHAQTPAAGTESLAWDQADSLPLAQVQSYVYSVSIDGGAPVVTPATCTGAASPYVCVIKFPQMVPGVHTVAVLAAVTVNGTTLTSAPSAPLSVWLVAIPLKPANVRIGAK